MKGDRRRAIGLSESIRQQRRELLEMGLQQARNFSETKREIENQKVDPPIAPVPVHQDDPPVDPPQDDLPVVQPPDDLHVVQSDDREVVPTKKEETFKMGKPHV